MNILLTGGAGYIGSHAALSLLDDGHKVHIIDNLSTGSEMLIPRSAKFTNCNINNEEVISNLIQSNNFDLLMHFAGFIQVEESVKQPEKYFENNTNNSIKLFNICEKNGLNKIVFSSTAAAYGLVSENKLIDEYTNLNPQNPYAESKIKTEKYLFDNKDKFQFIILRYFNVAGADKKLRSGQISKKSTHLIKKISEVVVGKRDQIEIFSSGFMQFHEEDKINDMVRDYHRIISDRLGWKLLTMDEFIVKYYKESNDDNELNNLNENIDSDTESENDK